MNLTFSIAIPTYNRLSLLRESLEAAIRQTLPGIEIIVSDNGSTDGTREFIERNKAVTYNRNEDNIGYLANFKRAFQLSHGQLFSWLQDDDLIHEDFARRGLEAFKRFPNLRAYLTFAFTTPLPNSVTDAIIYGPPFGGNWMRNEGLQIIPGTIVPALSLFTTVGFCPFAVFERNSLSKALKYIKTDYWLLMERVVLAAAVVDGDVAVDPYIGGIFRQHPGQASYDYSSAEFRTQWSLMASDLSEIAHRLPASWKADLTSVLPEITIRRREAWARAAIDWPNVNPFCQDVKDCLLASLPGSTTVTNVIKPEGNIKRFIRLLAPPLLFKLMSFLRKMLFGTRSINMSHK